MAMAQTKLQMRPITILPLKSPLNKGCNTRDETGLTQNWLKCVEASYSCNISKTVPEQQSPLPPMEGNIFSFDLNPSQRWQNLDQNWLKLANWLRSHIPATQIPGKSPIFRDEIKSSGKNSILNSFKIADQTPPPLFPKGEFLILTAAFKVTS